jgi:hypothetical protein
MVTTSFTALRRLAGFALTLMLFALWLSVQAMGQSTPMVTATSAVGLSHPTGWGTIQQTALDANGDWLVVDYANGALYEFPANGGPAITLAGDTPSASLGGGYQNPGIAIDPGNNLYLEANWNNCVVMFPWNGTSWTGLNDGGANPLSPSNPTTTICTNSGKGNQPAAWAQYGLSDSTGLQGGWFQPWGIGIGNHENLIWGTNSGGAGTAIESLTVNGAWSNPKPNTFDWIPISGLTARPVAVAQDPEGNLYFVEDYTSSSFLPGVYEIPATATNGQFTSDCGTPKGGPYTGSSCLTRVDPNLPAVTSVVTDSHGNLYISDSQVGVVMVPNPSGTPQTSSAVVLTSVPAGGQVSIDWARNLMYVPTKQKQTNGQADVAKVGFGYAELGQSAFGTATTAGANVIFSFNGSVTPQRAVILQDGASSSDFVISGGTCAMGTAYDAGSTCLETVQMTPHSVGSISGTLLLQQTQPVAAGQPGASAVVAASGSTPAWSFSNGVLTLNAANSFVAGQPISFSGAPAGSNLAPLNGHEMSVLAANSTSFTVSTSLVSACASGEANCPSATDTINVTGEEYATVASMLLHGTGVGSLVQTGPALESNLGGSLMLPSQIAVDAQGNLYVADAGLKKVLEYPAGSDTSTTPASIGSGLTSPSGVAVDGAGDLFIADSGAGAVYEIPMIASVSAPQGQMTLLSGSISGKPLGDNLRLAVDSLGDLYVADPGNGRVVELRNFNATGPLAPSVTVLTAGFTAPSAVAVDSNNNLYVIDGANLFELQGGFGAPMTLLNSLSGATDVAVDASGAVYVTSAGSTMRIPYVGGALAPGSATSLATAVTSPTAVAIDKLGNVYLTDGAAEDVHVVQANGTLTFAPFTSPDQSASLPVTVTNVGNAPLNITGFSATNPTVDTVSVTDWTTSDISCLGNPISAGATCQFDVNLAPGAGEEGALSSQISLVDDDQNHPVVNATGTAAALGGATTSATVASTSEVVNTSVTVTVTPSSTSGTPATPTGTIALTYPTWVVKAVNGVQTIVPQSDTVTATLDDKGTATFALAPVLAGADSFAVQYIGDRVYGRSTKTVTAAVAKSAITGIGLPTFPDPTDVVLPFVVAGTGGGTTPYSGMTAFQYNFIMNVNTAAGVPTGNITVMDNVTSCPPGTSPSGVGAANCNLPGYATPGGYSGVACPNSVGAGVLPIANAGTVTGAQASFPTSCLWFVPQGVTYSPVMYTHYIHPEYSGDANFLPLKGSVSTLFQSVRGPIVQITQAGNASSQTVAPPLTVQNGATASMDLTLTSVLGYGAAAYNAQLNSTHFPLSLSCDNLPPHSQCAFTYPVPDPNFPNSVDITCPTDTQSGNLTNLANGSEQCTQGQVTLTLYTNVSAGTTLSENAIGAPVTLAAIFGFGILGLFFRRKAFEKGRMMLMVLLMFVGGALAVSITACNTTTLTPQSSLSTPSGSYAMTVTAKAVGSFCSPSPGGAGDNCIVPGSGSATNNGILVYGSGVQVSLPFYVNVTVQ